MGGPLSWHTPAPTSFGPQRSLTPLDPPPPPLCFLPAFQMACPCPLCLLPPEVSPSAKTLASPLWLG